MLNRLKWVAASYVRRPMILAATAAAAFFFILSLLMSRSGQTHLLPAYPPPLFQNSVRSQGDLDFWQQSGRLGEVEMVYQIGRAHV